MRDGVSFSFSVVVVVVSVEDMVVEMNKILCCLFIVRDMPEIGNGSRDFGLLVMSYQQRPSRESIQEYNALLAESNLQASTTFQPVRAAPPPPRSQLQKRKQSMQETMPPPRPSRANTANLNDLFIDDQPLTSPTSPSSRRMSSPAPVYTTTPFYADPAEPLPEQTRSRSNTQSKQKKGVLGFIFNTTKRPEISTPYDPVHLTHVGFNSSTGEFTGLPKEWQQLLQESGISRSEQEKNPQAVMEIVKFYQEANGSNWDKLGAIPDTAVDDSPPPPPQKKPQSYRPAPTPPSALTPAIDRSTSQRAPSKPVKQSEVTRSNTTRSPRTPGSSSTDLPLKSPASPRERDPRAQQQQQPPSPAAQSLAKAAGTGVATPRRREKKVDKDKEGDIIKRLQAICTDADPTKLYRNLVKIGQGASGGVYTAYQVGTNLCVAIKQMDLEKQPKKDLIINEILVMRSSRHPNIVNYIDSFLYKNDLWVVMEYMEGGSLTDVVTANLMTEGQIAAVSRETAQGLEHLHRHGVIHRDIKSDNVLLSMVGDIKLSAAFFSFSAFLILPSRLWFLRPDLRSFTGEANHHGRHSLLDGS